MSSTTIIVDSDNKKAKINWFYLKIIIIGTIGGD